MTTTAVTPATPATAARIFNVLTRRSAWGRRGVYSTLDVRRARFAHLVESLGSRVADRLVFGLIAGQRVVGLRTERLEHDGAAGLVIGAPPRGCRRERQRRTGPRPSRGSSGARHGATGDRTSSRETIHPSGRRILRALGMYRREIGRVAREAASVHQFGGDLLVGQRCRRLRGLATRQQHERERPHDPLGQYFARPAIAFAMASSCDCRGSPPWMPAAAHAWALESVAGPVAGGVGAGAG